MLRYRTFFLIGVFLMSLLLFGCDIAKEVPYYENTPENISSTTEMPDTTPETVLPDSSSEPESIDSLDDLLLVKNMTLSEVIDRLGSQETDSRDSDYPLVYSWKLRDEVCLYVVFENEERDIFWEKMSDGSFVLPDETPEYDEYGMRRSTENEIRMLHEFILKHRAVSAYIIEGGEKTILFD